MGLRRPQPPGLVVPDEETRLALGGVGSAADGAGGRVLTLPERVPEALVEPVREAWELLGAHRTSRTYASALAGVAAQDVLEPREHGHHHEHGHDGHEQGHGGHGHEGHEDSHGGHDHGDMMAITGEPSADGLVMEDLDVQAGPLGVALPGGLVVAAALDGDVVASAEVQATLRAAEPGPPDPWSAQAWAAAERGARSGDASLDPAERWTRLAAVELERAVSHAAWLHGFSRLLGWAELTGKVRRVLESARAARDGVLTAGGPPESLPARLVAARAAAATFAADLEDDRRLTWRTQGVGRLDAGRARARGLTGPAARASGLEEDARMGDPGYVLLGHAPLLRHEGDARARTLVRVAEIGQSLELAAAALARGQDAPGAPEPAPAFAGEAESARGPVRVALGADGALRRSAPGAPEARIAAADLAVGLEWGSALVTVASFDLSPWAVEA